MAYKNIGTAFKGGSVMGIGAPAFRGGGKGYGIQTRKGKMYFATPSRAAQAAKVWGGSILKGYKKGGKVNKTGPAYLHKGERVLNKKQTQKYDRKNLSKAAEKMFGKQY